VIRLPTSSPKFDLKVDWPADSHKNGDERRQVDEARQKKRKAELMEAMTGLED
jgi:hypothetical protein